MWENLHFRAIFPFYEIEITGHFWPIFGKFDNLQKNLTFYCIFKMALLFLHHRDRA